MLVAFPIGLFVTSFAFDLIATVENIPSLWAAAWYCVIAGLIMGILAAISGVVDLFSVVPPRSSTRGLKHAGLNLAVIVVFIVVAAYRGGPNPPNAPSLILSAIGVLLLLFSGWLGATLVYRNQIGVDHRYANAGKWKEVQLNDWNQAVCKEGDLAAGQMMLATIQGARVAVAPCAEGLVAFSDHCTHKGGTSVGPGFGRVHCPMSVAWPVRCP